MQAPGAKLIVASLHAPCPPGPDHFEIQIATFFLGFIHVYPQILSAPFQNEYCHYIPLHLIIYIPTNIPFHPTNHYIPLHRGKHPMTHGVSPFPAPFPLLLLYLQPRNHIRKRSRNFIEAEGGVLAYEVTQAIHHMRVIGHKSETAIGTSAPGR